jgi:hypothetical protein
VALETVIGTGEFLGGNFIRCAGDRRNQPCGDADGRQKGRCTGARIHVAVPFLRSAETMTQAVLC